MLVLWRYTRPMRLLFILFICFPLSTFADIAIKGLFSGAALVEIDGQSHVIKKGQTIEGIKLIDANSSRAVIEVNGQRQTLGISDAISTQFTSPAVATVRIVEKDGHHVTYAVINGQRIPVLVDTGATHISLNEPTARKLNIKYHSGTRGVADTANGRVPIYMVMLKEVAIGEIVLKNVSAVVHVGRSPPITLLGNSFLSRVKMSTEGRIMVLQTIL